ncbi:MAG: hypothetical protein ACRCS9_09675, partial [Hyphomicrobium sp.]
METPLMSRIERRSRRASLQFSRDTLCAVCPPASIGAPTFLARGSRAALSHSSQSSKLQTFAFGVSDLDHVLGDFAAGQPRAGDASQSKIVSAIGTWEIRTNALSRAGA